MMVVVSPPTRLTLSPTIVYRPHASPTVRGAHGRVNPPDHTGSPQRGAKMHDQGKWLAALRLVCRLNEFA